MDNYVAYDTRIWYAFGMKYSEWEAIDDELFAELGEELVSVSKEQGYTVKMGLQNGRMLKFLEEKYPERTFRISKWKPHDFGEYQEVEEHKDYDDGEDEEDEEGFLANPI